MQVGFEAHGQLLTQSKTRIFGRCHEAGSPLNFLLFRGHREHSWRSFLGGNETSNRRADRHLPVYLTNVGSTGIPYLATIMALDRLRDPAVMA